MFTRQATLFFLTLALLLGLSACGTPDQTPPTATASPSPSPTVTPLPLLPTVTLAPTPLTCLSQPGQLQSGSVATPGLPTNFIIYLPPCYDRLTDRRYPVIYLLNGLPFPTDTFPPGEQWIHIGAPAAANQLILSGQAEPFIIVFPEDRYWNLDQGLKFGEDFINYIIPYIDENFRTIPDRAHRALGGFSRGGGWTVKLGLFQTDLFGSVGLHSPAVFEEDRTNVIFWIQNHDPNTWPRIYFDSGDNDRERGFNSTLEDLLTQYGIPHEWHLNNGAHDEAYWSAHVLEYLTWYADGFALADGWTAAAATSTPAP